MIRQERQQQSDPHFLRKNEIKRLRRRMRALERQGEQPPEEMVERYRSLDTFLTEADSNWNAKCPRARVVFDGARTASVDYNRI